MLRTYFERNGFKVKNLETLCDAFESAFPEGMRVNVETIEPETAPTPPPAPEPVVATEAPVKPKGKVKGNPRLGASDLMDPSSDNRPPSRDELLAQRDLELEHMLRQSDALKESR